jgi:O-6-methylguanine DNA methyltransferase
MKYYYKYNILNKDIFIVSENEKIILVRDNYINEKGDINNETKLIERCHKQIEEYISGRRNTFDVEFELKGTKFQRKVYDALINVPYGETRTYKQISEIVNSPKASRAVGNACNKNPLLFLVPCHRVVGTNGDLTGFALGLDMKENLLEIEKVTLK